MAGPTNEIDTETAKKLYESAWWEGKTAREIAQFQLFTAQLCMPFSIFHKALEEALGRPVWTHELGLNYGGICAEFLGETAPPTLAQIMALIPREKLIVLGMERAGGE